MTLSAKAAGVKRYRQHMRAKGYCIECGKRAALVSGRGVKGGKKRRSSRCSEHLDKEATRSRSARKRACLLTRLIEAMETAKSLMEEIKCLTDTPVDVPVKPGPWLGMPTQSSSIVRPTRRPAPQQAVLRDPSWPRVTEGGVTRDLTPGERVARGDGYF